MSSAQTTPAPVDAATGGSPVPSTSSPSVADSVPAADSSASITPLASTEEKHPDVTLEWTNSEGAKLEPSPSWPISQSWRALNGSPVLGLEIHYSKEQYIPDPQGLRGAVSLPGTKPGKLQIELRSGVRNAQIAWKENDSSGREVRLDIRLGTVEAKAAPGTSDYSGGLGFSYFGYSEKPYDLSISQFGISGQFAGHQPISSKFEFAEDLGVTLLPLSSSASLYPLSRFYSVGLRIGWVTPLNWGDLRWTLSTGGALWGMLVPDSAYGVTALKGLQVMLSARPPRAFKGARGGYLKFSSFGGGQEIGAGIEQQLDSTFLGRPIGAGFELSMVSFKSSSDGNSLSLMSGQFVVRASFGSSPPPGKNAEGQATASK